jgi:hypothetical protein
MEGTILQAELSQQKKALRSKKALPGAKKRSWGLTKVLPGAPEQSTFAEHYFLHNNNKVAKANHHTSCLLPLLQHYCQHRAAADPSPTPPPTPPPLPPLCRPFLSIRRMCSIAAVAACRHVMEEAALLSVRERSDRAIITDFE